MVVLSQFSLQFDHQFSRIFFKFLPPLAGGGQPEKLNSELQNTIYLIDPENYQHSNLLIQKLFILTLLAQALEIDKETRRGINTL